MAVNVGSALTGSGRAAATSAAAAWSAAPFPRQPSEPHPATPPKCRFADLPHAAEAAMQGVRRQPGPPPFSPAPSEPHPGQRDHPAPVCRAAVTCGRRASAASGANKRAFSGWNQALHTAHAEVPSCLRRRVRSSASSVRVGRLAVQIVRPRAVPRTQRAGLVFSNSEQSCG
jgi:hypothetical protein